VYRLTESGRRHLGEWLVVLERLTEGLERLTESIRQALSADALPPAR
jgi:DNA-binding PadR family transcriptional regulator